MPMTHFKHIPELTSRFHTAKPVVVLLTESECWHVVSHMPLRGRYVRLHRGNKEIAIHRLSYSIFKGEITPDLYVCHHCDNPQCINPAHLFLGTQKDNMKDMRNKKRERNVRGEKQWQAKLTEQNIREIRERRTSGETLISIARDYGVRPTNIAEIALYRTWKHIN